MTKPSNSFQKIIRVILLTGLVLAAAWLGQPGHLALAQEPDGVGVDVVLTPAPTAVEPPQATEEPESDSGLLDPSDTGVIDPPSDEMLGEIIKAEDYVGGDDLEDDANQVIDIFDLSFVASHYGGDSLAADVNLDGKVDIFDLSLLASNYNETGPAEALAITAAQEPLPLVETGIEEFGALDLPVETPVVNADVEASYVSWRPLRIGLGINYTKIYDLTDAQSHTSPDPYAVVSVGGVAARTATWWNSYEVWPNWRLGWWRYGAFPWAPGTDYYNLPINLEIRDDDGRVCYGYYGCRDWYETVDISPELYQRAKNLTFYPATCRLRDEAGVYTNGYWLDSGHNRCRVHLQAWGTEWPRGYVSYFIDAIWD